MQRTIRTLTLLSTLLLLPACQTLPQTNHVQRLLKHPEFNAAARAAPAFTKDALHTINDLQLELQKLKTQ